MTFELQSPQPRPKRLEAKVNAVLARHEALFNQVARGNLSASERAQLYRSHQEFQAALPGLGSGFFNIL